MISTMLERSQLRNMRKKEIAYEVFNIMEKDILEKTKDVSSDHAWFRKLG